ncbi:uncharacterized protein LOC130642060 [Hydractinia symbiolongicarpus]|uniref:uncharacterized protein LOC130642060 n=1 Tax=Hydractinia symbiolongicarpus TaxID=13093 RepID=UPI00254B43CA|nr:uncharacterized protein LOC130642060 [Hydractinia symbiolongicarpus]
MVKCRFAKGGQECGAICDGLPGATIDEDKCTLTYNANQQKGLFPISIQIEDYASKTSTIPLSSVALQFLINVYQSTGKCSDKPYFSSTSPLDASCENIPVNGTYITRIIATSGSPNDHITEFTTSSPSGMIKSDVQKVINTTGLPTLAKGVTWYYINVTWTARQNQKGANIFCFTAVAQSKRNSERRCITLYVGASTPKIDKLSLQPKPNEIVRSTIKIFTFRYDQDIIKTTSNALIKILRDDGKVTYNFTIDSNNIKILQNRIIEIYTPGLKFEEARRYTIVADAGFVKGKHECGKEADVVTSNFGWSFVVSDNFPRLLNSPAVNVNVVNGKMQFRCGFQASNGNPRAVYEVEWFNGDSDNPIKKDIITNNNTSNLVYHSQFCLGTELHCKVRSWFSNSTNIKSNLHESEKFFIGVKSDPEVITLVEGQDPVQVTLSPTIPIICVNNTDLCEVEVAIAQQNLEVMLSRCSVKFGPKHPSRQTITIYPKEDFIVDGRKSVTLRRILHGTRGVSNWLCYEDTKAIQLTVDDRPTLQCSSTGDPHIYTFDNDRRYFDLHYPGDFVMVQSVKNNFKVHARTFMCRKSIACNCAIAAQENDDVVSIDVCKGGPKFRFPMSQNQHSGTKLNKISNSQYEVIMKI